MSHKSIQKLKEKLNQNFGRPFEMKERRGFKKALCESPWFLAVDPSQVVMVVGTNGKGTTSKALSRLLMAEGFRVGLFTSPHLVEINERIEVNGRPISDGHLLEAYLTCEGLIERYQLNHSEALTLMAGEYFFGREPVDYAVFEASMGGRLDACNYIPHQTTLLTTIGLDHTQFLGTSESEILKEKLGAVPRAGRLVSNPLSPELEAQVRDRISTLSAEWIRAEPPGLKVLKGEEPKFIGVSPWGEFLSSLPGRRAVENMNLALLGFSVLGFSPQERLGVLSKVEWPGRMTLLTREPCLTYLSGDHNLQGLESLLEILPHYSYEDLHVVLGVGERKSISDFVKVLENLPRTKIYLCRPPFRGQSVMGFSGGESVVFKSEDPHEALGAAQSVASSQDMILVTGSLYLVGEFLRSFRAPLSSP